MSSVPSLAQLTTPGPWQQEAACQDADPNLFFATDDVSQAEAMSMCAACPVRAECLEYALTNRETYGIWGGATENERRRLARQRRRAA